MAIDIIFHFVYSLCLYGNSDQFFEDSENAENYGMTKRMKRGFSVMVGGSKINKMKLELEKVYPKLILCQYQTESSLLYNP